MAEQPGGGPLRVVIADDNYLVREGTRRLLEDSGEVTVQAAVGSAAELLDAVGRLGPDAVLTDIRMPAGPGGGADGGPAMEGIDAAHEIKARAPGVGVLILSQYADEAYAFELFRNGTAGLAYLLKDRVGDLAQLLAALRAVAAGGSVIDPQVVEALVSRRARLRESPLARLTPRELDVLREMAQGRGNAGIAQALFLSESSVEKHVNAIFAKLDLASEQQVNRRVAAVLTFLRDAGLRTPGGLAAGLVAEPPPGLLVQAGRGVAAGQVLRAVQLDRADQAVVQQVLGQFPLVPAGRAPDAALELLLVLRHRAVAGQVQVHRDLDDRHGLRVDRHAGFAAVPVQDEVPVVVRDGQQHDLVPAEVVPGPLPGRRAAASRRAWPGRPRPWPAAASGWSARGWTR